MQSKYDIKPRNQFGLITIVERSSGKVVHKCKSVSSAAYWMFVNGDKGELI